MGLRETNIEKLGQGVYDVLVLGGGINGAVAAAALAARGAKVALIDRGDFAGFTSQESSNLAWGGIKYMESFEFPLVRKLWGKGKGRFRTRGRYSIGGVRGTWWATEDRCDGTLTRVKRGVVSVRDLVRHRTVMVHAGESYLARAPRRGG